MDPDTTVREHGRRTMLGPASQFPNARHLMNLACLVATPGLARVDNGWELERTSGQPTFATAIPSDTNLNIDAVVLACERADHRAVLQLQLHPSGDDVAIRAIGPPIWSYGRRAEITIGERVFAADVLIADDYVVVANESRGRFPTLADPLLDAMATGRTMVVRRTIDVESISRDRGVDGYAKVDLRAGHSSRAIAALRRCASPTASARNALGPVRL
jgi:hypothetical protein